MPSPVELLKQECKGSPRMSAPLAPHAASHTTPSKHEHGPYFQSHQFQTPSARHAQLPAESSAKCLHSHSPHLKTPSTTSSRGTPRTNTPGSAGVHRVTPHFHTTPGGSSHQIVLNPFEGPLLDKLHSHSPMFSPNMFKVTDPGSAEKSPTVFRWSIDQMAILKPAELEERPIQQDTLNIVRDPMEEARVQEAIDLYFQAGNIVPSPWTNNVRKVFLPRTPDPEREPSMTLLDTAAPHATAKHEAECQTVLTLPVDFNLQQVLGEHYTYTSSQQQPPKIAHNHIYPAALPDAEDVDPEMVLAAQARAEEVAASVAALFDDSPTEPGPADLSTSSLRRKLFFHGDEGTPLSPVRSNKSRVGEIMDMSSPAVSPVRSHTSQLSRHSPLITPASSHFSSSPIRGEQTPSLRRCSTAPSLSDSPQISPIFNSASSKGSRGVAGTPMCLPLQATPSSGRPSKPLHSPGFSPIHHGGDGSYVSSPPDKLAFSRSDSLRRRALIGQTEKHTPSPDLSPFNLMQHRPPLFCSSPSPITPFRHHSVDVKGIEDAKCRINFDQPGDKDIDLSDQMDVSCGEESHARRGQGVDSPHTIDDLDDFKKNVGDNGMNFKYVNRRIEDSAVVTDDVGYSHVYTTSDDIRDTVAEQREDVYIGGLAQSAAFRDFREVSDYDCETTTGFHASISSTMCSGHDGHAQGQDTIYQTQDTGYQSQDTGYHTQYSVVNEATMSTNLTNHFSNLPSGLGSSQDDVSPIEARHSLEEMSEFYDKISHSLSEATPACAQNAGSKLEVGARQQRSSGFPLSSTMLSPPQSNAHAKDKSKEKIFEELQQFANKFSPSKFERQISDCSTFTKGHIGDDGGIRLHKSCSVGEFKTAYGSRDFVSILHHSRTNSGFNDPENNNEIQPKTKDKVQFQLDRSQTQDSFESQSNCVKSERAQFGIAQIQSETEQLGDLPSFEKVPMRPKTLMRSMSDYTGSRFRVGHEADVNNDSLPTGQGLYKGRSAHTNPAFKIETLTPRIQDVIPQDSANTHTKELSMSPKLSKHCDVTHSKSDVMMPPNRKGSKLAANERSGNIRPRLLFADDSHQYPGSRHSSADLTEYDPVQKQKTDFHLADRQQPKEFHHESLFRNQYSFPERISERTSSDTLHVSPKSSLETDKKILVNAKRVLADQYAISQARTKRRSPTQLDEDTRQQVCTSDVIHEKLSQGNVPRSLDQVNINAKSNDFFKSANLTDFAMDCQGD